LALPCEPSGELRLLNSEGLGKLRDSPSAVFAECLNLAKQSIKQGCFLCFHKVFKNNAWI